MPVTQSAPNTMFSLIFVSINLLHIQAAQVLYFTRPELARVLVSGTGFTVSGTSLFRKAPRIFVMCLQYILSNGVRPDFCAVRPKNMVCVGAQQKIAL